MDAAGEDLGSSDLDQLAAFSAALDERGDERLQPLVDQLKELESLERETNPTNSAGRALLKRVPPFLLFDAANRELQPEYAWDDWPTASAALENLCALAGVGYESYRSVATDHGVDPV